MTPGLASPVRPLLSAPPPAFHPAPRVCMCSCVFLQHATLHIGPGPHAGLGHFAMHAGASLASASARPPGAALVLTRALLRSVRVFSQGSWFEQAPQIR